jgi:hypothetical protein
MLPDRDAGGSNKRPASRASTVLLSAALMPRSLTESSTMLSWRGGRGRPRRSGQIPHVAPLGDSRIVSGASSETALDEQMMKVEQRRHRHARRADRRHAGAGHRGQHPFGDGRDRAGHCLGVNKPAGKALLAVIPPDTAPKERVPAIIVMTVQTERLRLAKLTPWGWAAAR